ncbi:JmjC domain-containing protein [Patulibacter sp.]|uniref:JmjC domain-containing protein n=1 Tax=Patulibacter sp. TaxID=1912859 RepID=UPI002715A55A|nr:cupin domain-containing protein [Patulibacter sp.]MDO9407225.1 cupin domain-containing protein [Patulibacter sp.]
MALQSDHPDLMLTIDPSLAAAAYDRSPFAVGHGAHTHPLLTLESLVALAGTHPADAVEHNLGAVPVALPGGEAPRLELEPAQVLAEIAANGSWLVLKNVERDDRYRALLDELLDEAAGQLPGEEGTALHREAFIFVSAPGAITPAHVDPEQNMLLQVRGTKAMHVGRFADDESRARELERFYAGHHRNLQTRPVDEETFDLHPGEGVYVPPNAPHWVQNGDDVSISLSVTWRTRSTGRTGAILAMNHRIRSAGRRPHAPGVSRPRDAAKVAVHRAMAVGARVRGRA